MCHSSLNAGAGSKANRARGGDTQAAKLHFAINLKIAKALDLTIPPSLLVQC